MKALPWSRIGAGGLVLVAVMSTACVQVRMEQWDASDACAARAEWVAAVQAGPDAGVTWEDREELMQRFREMSAATGDERLTEVGEDLAEAEEAARRAQEALGTAPSDSHSEAWDQATQDLVDLDEAARKRCDELVDGR